MQSFGFFLSVFLIFSPYPLSVSDFSCFRVGFRASQWKGRFHSPSGKLPGSPKFKEYAKHQAEFVEFGRCGFQGVPMGSMLSSYIAGDWPSTFSLFNTVRWLLGMLDKTTKNSGIRRTWNSRSAKECFASGETCFQSRGELDPVQPDPQPLQPLVATWRTREVLVLLQILFLLYGSLADSTRQGWWWHGLIYTECKCYSWIGKHIHRFFYTISHVPQIHTHTE